MRCLVTVLFLALTMNLTGIHAYGQEVKKEPEPREIKLPWELLNSNVKLVGKLGVPFGTVVPIEGVWRSRKSERRIGHSETLHEFVITEMNGKKLTESNFIVFHKKQLEWPVNYPRRSHVPDGTRLKGKVYETGQFIGVPDNSQRIEYVQMNSFRFELTVRFDTGIATVVDEKGDRIFPSVLDKPEPMTHFEKTFSGE